jgi:hypothetical protein
MKKGSSEITRRAEMPQANRITPEEARKKVAAGQAMLVCAYEDSEKCRRYDLDGSLNFQELWRRQPGKQQEIIFYCA